MNAAYVSGQLNDGTMLPLFRLRYDGSANSWGFAIHLASRNGYEEVCKAIREEYQAWARSPLDEIALGLPVLGRQFLSDASWVAG